MFFGNGLGGGEGRGRTIARITGALIMCAAYTATLGAQIRRPRASAQVASYWVGVSYGLFELGSMTDDATNGVWQFGYTSQLSATLDKELGGGSTVGLMVGFASPNVTYSSASASPGSACFFSSCTATTNVTQILGTARLGGGGSLGLRGGFVLQAGATQIGKFKEKATGNSLPGGGGWDPTLGTGFGLGYLLGRKTEIYFQTGFTFVLHAQESGSVNSTPPRSNALTFGVREGF
jgi:hypothetical protein